MRYSTRFIAVLAISLTMVACTNEDMGTVVGSIGGAAIGSQFGRGGGAAAAMVGGAVLGGFIGNRVGKSMDTRDQQAMGQALSTQPTNQGVTWVNNSTHNQYTLTPTRDFYQGGRNCREFQQQAMIAGRKQHVFGTACQRSDGSWEVVS